MDFLKHFEETPIQSACASDYNGMAFDGLYYFFLIPCVFKIIKTDQCYREVDCFETYREYNCICYDCKECCFWASSRKRNNKIFKLDNCMKEIDCISVCGYKEASGIITGISYNCCCDTLMVSFTGCVVAVNKNYGEAVLKYESCNLRIIGICCISPYYIITAIRDNNQYVTLFDPANQPLYTQAIPCEYNIKTIVFNPCITCDRDYRFDVLANKNGCYPYIIEVKTESCNINFHPCSCNHCMYKKYCEKIPCKPSDTCTDILESIALVEASLSHILNAEGEKLQKVLAATDDIDEILRVNKEINKTIINATHLEHTLYAKLSTLLDCCNCGCCDSDNISTCDIDGET